MNKKPSYAGPRRQRNQLISQIGNLEAEIVRLRKENISLCSELNTASEKIRNLSNDLAEKEKDLLELPRVSGLYYRHKNALLLASNSAHSLSEAIRELCQ